MTASSIAIFIAAAATAGGCGRGAESSADIPLSDIYADFEVRANGTSSSMAQASLRIDSNTYLELTGSDRLVASAAQFEFEMSQNEFLGIVTYNATFEISDEGTIYTIAFERSSGPQATDSWAELPPPFELDAPLSVETFSRSDDDIELRYSPSGSPDLMRWTVTGGCVEYEESALEEDDGSLVIEAGTLTPVGDVGEGCTATLRAERVRVGTIDQRFGDGGIIWAIQVRAVDIELTP